MFDVLCLSCFSLPQAAQTSCHSPSAASAPPYITDACSSPSLRPSPRTQRQYCVECAVVQLCMVVVRSSATANCCEM